MLDLVGLSGFSDRYPRTLSGGQQQRVALARSLIFNPDVLLLDEPLGALDKNLREQMQLEIKRIHRELGMTMIYVTHDQAEAIAMSDRIAVFKSGQLEQVGSPFDIYNRPISKFVAEFVGDSNLFSARYKSAGSKTIVLDDGTELDVDGLTGFEPGESRTQFQIMVRPERMTIVSDENQLNHSNVMSLIIEDVVNCGDSVLLIGTMGGILAKIRISGAPPDFARRGMKIPISWRTDSAHVLFG
jgi:putative spermidine/putrescine transport system ATP-binding protein